MEAAIGLIQTVFNVEGPGLISHFNAQAGGGWDFGTKESGCYFAHLRIRLLSTGTLSYVNRGDNQVLLQFGRGFDGGDRGQNVTVAPSAQMLKSQDSALIENGLKDRLGIR